MVGVLLGQQFQKDDDQEGYRADGHDCRQGRVHIDLKSTTSRNGWQGIEAQAARVSVESTTMELDRPSAPKFVKTCPHCRASAERPTSGALPAGRTTED
jgi:hypothetical protein